MSNARKLAIGFLVTLSLLSVLHWTIAVVAGYHLALTAFNLWRGHCWYNWTIVWSGFSVAHAGVTKDGQSIAILQFSVPIWMMWTWNRLHGRDRGAYRDYKTFSLHALPNGILKHLNAETHVY